MPSVPERLKSNTTQSLPERPHKKRKIKRHPSSGYQKHISQAASQNQCQQTCYDVLAHAAVAVMSAIREAGTLNQTLMETILTELLYKPRKGNKEDLRSLLTRFLSYTSSSHRDTFTDAITNLFKKADCSDLIPDKCSASATPVDDVSPDASTFLMPVHSRSSSERKLKEYVGSICDRNAHGISSSSTLQRILKLSRQVESVVINAIEVITCFRGESCLGLLMAYDRQGGKRVKCIPAHRNAPLNENNSRYVKRRHASSAIK
jgi:hypothetical protein